MSELLAENRKLLELNARLIDANNNLAKELRESEEQKHDIAQAAIEVYLKLLHLIDSEEFAKLKDVVDSELRPL